MRRLQAREARLWNYYNSDQTGFFPMRQWPEWAQDLLLAEHRGNNDLWKLTYFLLANGMNPEGATVAALIYDVRTNHLGAAVPLLGRYNAGAQKDVRKITEKYMSGSLRDRTYFDMILQRVVTGGVVQAPPGQRK